MINSNKENKPSVHGIAVFAVNGTLEMMPLTEGHFKQLKEQGECLVEHEKKLTTITEENIENLKLVKERIRCNNSFSQLFSLLQANQASSLDQE